MLRCGRTPVLLGSYLFPFYAALATAGEMLREKGYECRTVAIPAGSDVWQLGRQMPSVLQHVLDYKRTAGIVTYSFKFANELRSLLSSKIETTVAVPPLDTARFQPLEANQRTAARYRLGLPPSALVLLHCSNMRPVKRVDVVLQLAVSFARAYSKETWLVLVGPATEHLRTALSEVGARAGADPGCWAAEKLRIVHTGLVHDVEVYQKIADLALNASLHDSFNVSLAESLACGVPVVSSDVIGLGEITDGSECLIRFSYPLDGVPLSPEESPNLPPAAIDQVIGRMLELVEDRDKVVACRVEAARIIRENCSREVVRNDWEEAVFGDLLHPRNSIARLGKRYG